MAGAKEYGADQIDDTSYSLTGDVVRINSVDVIKNKSPNGFPGFEIIGTGCSGQGCTYILPIDNTAIVEDFPTHRRKSHSAFTDGTTGELLVSVYLYAPKPDYESPPVPVKLHGNAHKVRSQKRI